MDKKINMMILILLQMILMEVSIMQIKLLVVPSDRTGVGKFRSIDPHIFLQKNYSEDFHVDIVFEPDLNDISFWKQYHIVHYHRSVSPDLDASIEFIPILNKLGIIYLIYNN
jgi:hypothetical protein